MRQFVLFLFASLSLGSVASAQDQHEYKKKAPKVVHTNETGPVTEAEAQATFKRLGTVIKSVVHVSVPAFKSASSKPVSRFDVANYFLKAFKAIEPVMTVTPTPFVVETKRISANSKSQRETLALLIKGGFVGNYSPMATGKGTSLTVEQFGDAVGLFVSRIAEDTHTPSSKWTPYLHGF